VNAEHVLACYSACAEVIKEFPKRSLLACSCHEDITNLAWY